MIREDELTGIGRISRLHGKRGEVQCILTNELLYDSDADFVFLRLDGLYVPFRVVEWHGKGADSVLFSLQGVATEQQALRLVGAEVFLLRKDCTAVEENSEDLLTWQDLSGYRLYDADGVDRGVIAEVDETTANTLCRTDYGLLFPLHEDLILRIDTSMKEIALNVKACV
ncbi:MAG: hypothetical protein K5660_01440 [Paludibacteraceae bacterium]|nr:hypothetical protein [Paludibacteraceae bacterium]